MMSPDLLPGVSPAGGLTETAQSGHEAAHRGARLRMRQRQWRVGLAVPTQLIKRREGLYRQVQFICTSKKPFDEPIQFLPTDQRPVQQASPVFRERWSGPTGTGRPQKRAKRFDGTTRRSTCSSASEARLLLHLCRMRGSR